MLLLFYLIFICAGNLIETLSFILKKDLFWTYIQYNNNKSQTDRFIDTVHTLFK